MISEHGYGITRSYMDKAKSQKFHCKKRARERLKFELTDDLYQEIIKSIKHKPSQVITKLLYKQSNRVNVYEVNMQNKVFNICYDTQRHTIITILDQIEEKMIYSFVDVFGNKHAVLELFGVTSLRLDSNNNIINVKFEHINKKEKNNCVYYELPEYDRIFKLEDKILIEVMK